MFSRAAVLPQPPLLVPELMGGSTTGTEPLREAWGATAEQLTTISRDWLVLAAGEAAGPYSGPGRGSLRGYGVDREVSLDETCAGGEPRSAVDMPLPALLAGWLRERAGARTARVEFVGADAEPSSCEALGQHLTRTAHERALLVLGDGSNRRGARAPGGNDDRAADFDATVAGALAGARRHTLRELDPALAAELGAGGRAPWQVLAALNGQGDWRGRLLFSDAPFGVGYHVALWDRT